MRRNDELALLYEKIKIQQSILNKGQIQYRERLERAAGSEDQARGSARASSRCCESRRAANVDVLKREVHHLGQGAPVRERTKVKALSEELENPLNVHRWREARGARTRRRLR